MLPTIQEKEYLLDTREGNVSFLYRDDGTMLIGTVQGCKLIVVYVTESGMRLSTYTYDVRESL